MEFQAYAPRAQGRKQALIWKLQDALHSKNSLILPCAILLAAAAILLYAHMSKSPIRCFIAVVLLSMFPLAFLEKQILSCPDPLSAISRISGKLLISHACGFALRLPLQYEDDGAFSTAFAFTLGAVVAICVLLPTCFRVRSLRALFGENRDVWGFMLLGIVAAEVSTPHMVYMGLSRGRIFETAALYLEMLAFVPAVALMSRPAKYDSEKKQADIADTRSRCLILFACLLGFYFRDDVVAAYQLRNRHPLASMTHLVHFALLLDLAVFVLAHFFDPAKLEKLCGAFVDIWLGICAV